MLFPSPEGELYDLHNFRRREYTWARDAAGLPRETTLNSLRHSGISWALGAGIPASDVARLGGTSVTMLERVYAHLLVSRMESARARLDAFAVEYREQAEAAEERLGVE